MWAARPSTHGSSTCTARAALARRTGSTASVATGTTLPVRCGCGGTRSSTVRVTSPRSPSRTTPTTRRRCPRSLLGEREAAAHRGLGREARRECGVASELLELRQDRRVVGEQLLECRSIAGAIGVGELDHALVEQAVEVAIVDAAVDGPRTTVGFAHLGHRRCLHVDADAAVF